jgi:hypothetical protein
MEEGVFHNSLSLPLALMNGKRRFKYRTRDKECRMEKRSKCSMRNGKGFIMQQPFISIHFSERKEKI